MGVQLPRWVAVAVAIALAVAFAFFCFTIGIQQDNITSVVRPNAM